MSDSSDFTFCQVGLISNDNLLDSPETVPNIGKITLDDSSMGGVNNSLINSATQGNGSQDNETKYSEFSGSLSNNSGKSDSITPKVVEKAGDTQNGVQQKKPTVKRPAVRAKVPFEKGYSQMDWLKLTRTDPDLAGLKGRSNRRLISMDEVKQHKAEEGSIWTVLKGRVYNISPYMKFHPGGVDMLMKAAGRDCTALFNKYHAWVNAEFLLEKCLVGVLDDSL